MSGSPSRQSNRDVSPCGPNSSATILDSPLG
jgi:hypothetical protein